MKYQTDNNDLTEAANESLVVINALREKCNDELVWEELFEKAKAMTAEWNIEPTIPRLASSQRHGVDIPSVARKEYCRMALDMVDHLLEELNERLLNQHDRFLGQHLIPTRIHLLNPDRTDRFSTHMNLT